MYLMPIRTNIALSYHFQSPLTRPDSLPYLFRKLRIHRNLSRKAFALKMGVSEEYISWIEEGQKPPSLHFCLRCAEEFDINPQWLKLKWYKETLSRIKQNLERKLELI